jgi:hypothetical protein
VPRSLQYPECLSENDKFKAGSQIDSIHWRKLFMSECTFVKEVVWLWAAMDNGL